MWKLWNRNKNNKVNVKTIEPEPIEITDRFSERHEDAYNEVTKGIKDKDKANEELAKAIKSILSDN